MVKDALEAVRCMVIATPDGEQAVHLFYEMSPDCVILDITLQSKSGFEILKAIQKQADVSFVPIIMMSAKDDKATRIRCFTEGADAFCSKPVGVDELIIRISRLLKRRGQLKQLLLQDPFLGIYTMKFLQMELNRLLITPSREEMALGLQCLDIDGFAEVNKVYGHSEGNRLLKEYVRIMQASLNPKDLLIHDQGDRFFLLAERWQMAAERLVTVR